MRNFRRDAEWIRAWVEERALKEALCGRWVPPKVQGELDHIDWLLDRVLSELRPL